MMKRSIKIILSLLLLLAVTAGSLSLLSCTSGETLNRTAVGTVGA